MSPLTAIMGAESGVLKIELFGYSNLTQIGWQPPKYEVDGFTRFEN